MRRVKYYIVDEISNIKFKVNLDDYMRTVQIFHIWAHDENEHEFYAYAPREYILNTHFKRI